MKANICIDLGSCWGGEGCTHGLYAGTHKVTIDTLPGSVFVDSLTDNLVNETSGFKGDNQKLYMQI